jgi:hypothetical protein
VAELLTDLSPGDTAAVERFLGEVTRVSRDALDEGAGAEVRPRRPGR